MKHFIPAFAAVLITCSSYCFAQVPGWQWARGAGSSGEDISESVAVDANGNVYATGSFTSATITFGAFTLTNAGGGTADVLLVKYDPAGTVLWAKSVGDVDGDIGHSVSIDGNGNAYITGWFSSPTITFGGTTLTNSGSGSADIFIVKYQSDGSVVWAKSAGGVGTDVGYGIAADASGNVYMTGMFASATAAFGSVNLSNGGGNAADIFLARYDASGNLSWAKGIGGTGPETGYGVATDAGGNAYMTGWFGSPSVTFGTTTLTANGSAWDLFVVKYDASGNVGWAKSNGGTGNESGNSIAVDASNNVYVTGYFESATVAFGSTTLTCKGYSDCFLVKYNSSGTIQWANGAGEEYDDAGTSTTVSSTGDVYLTGKFLSSAITFGATTLTNISAGGADIFVVKFSSAGTMVWVTGSGASYQDIPTGVAVSAAGDILISGKFDSPSISFGTTTLYKGCGNDFFVASLGTAVGIEQYMRAESLSIYPNPSNGVIRVSSDEAISGTEVFNALGEKVTGLKSIQQTSATATVDLSALHEGIYFIKVSTASGIVTKKLVLKD